MKRKSQDFPGDLGPILLISELALGNNLMVQFHHLVRLGHSRLRVVTAAASMPVKSRILRVVYTLPVVVALTSALVVTVITRPSYKEVSDTESLSDCRS